MSDSAIGQVGRGGVERQEGLGDHLSEAGLPEDVLHPPSTGLRLIPAVPSLLEGEPDAEHLGHEGQPLTDEEQRVLEILKKFGSVNLYPQEIAAISGYTRERCIRLLIGLMDRGLTRAVSWKIGPAACEAEHTERPCRYCGVKEVSSE